MQRRSYWRWSEVVNLSSKEDPGAVSVARDVTGAKTVCERMVAVDKSAIALKCSKANGNRLTSTIEPERKAAALVSLCYGITGEAS